MNTECSKCVKCGAPMYMPSSWSSIIPPPVTRTCACFPTPQVIITTDPNSTILPINQSSTDM